MKSIALCGFMGCGKSTIATALCEKYALKHIDTDKYIEETNATTINKIFTLHSEDYFRDKEFEAIKTLSKEKDCVLALGGGAVMFKRNVDVLKENGCIIVFIDTDLEIIKNRLKADTTRPLLKTNDIDDLYNKRYETYKNASDIVISCKDEYANSLAKMIIDKIKKA